MIKEFLFEMCSNQFVSGFEHHSEKIIKKYFRPFTDSFEKDNLGSCIFKASGVNDTKIMIAAHMDEIGLMVTDILDGGFLGFTSVGSVNPATLISQEIIVYGREKVYGVIGIKPPHITSALEMKKNLIMENLFIDTGYSREELEKKVEPGDIAVIKRTPAELQCGRIASRQLDNKAGVAVMLAAARELNKISHKSNIYYTATVLEETGYTGSCASGYKIDPHMAIVIDVGNGHSPGMPSESSVLGKGPAVAIGGKLNSNLTEKFISVCREYSYNFQYDAIAESTGTDVESLHTGRRGLPCILLSIPLRYMHTSVEVVDMADIQTTGKAIARFINELDHSDLEEILCF